MRTSQTLSLLFIAATLAVTSARSASAAVTPSDVYAVTDLLSRSLDVLLEARNVPPPAAPSNSETDLKPMHVYQLHVACVERLHEFEAQIKLPRIPLVVSRPMQYKPVDVRILSQLMIADVRRVAAALNIAGLPKTVESFSGKSPTDVFQVTLAVYVKLNALAGKTKITPNEVYSQLLRGAADARSILAHVDASRRYRIDVPAVDGKKTPPDVFAQCLEVRKTINKVREELKLGTTPIPQVGKAGDLRPEDVFVQTQIIIAELNLVKLGTNTQNSTPLAVPVSGKTPTSCYQQAAEIEYLLKQFTHLRSIVAQQPTIGQSARQ